MYMNAELHAALAAMHQAEIRRDVLGEHVVRHGWRPRPTRGAPRRLWAPVLQLGATLAHAVLGAPDPRAA